MASAIYVIAALKLSPEKKKFIASKNVPQTNTTMLKMPINKAGVCSLFMVVFLSVNQLIWLAIADSAFDIWLAISTPT